MNSVRITYDADGDILYIAFGTPRPATGYQLSDQILLRIDHKDNTPAGLTIFNFLHHVSSGTEIEIAEIEDDLMPFLSSEPVSRFLEIQSDGDGTIARLLEPSTPGQLQGDSH